tara:strand:+ start:17 stop:898 length:882 start_codon:yes stop_codon:yes gene_type:complete
MRTLGINISHNASICQVTDGQIDFYYEEDRFNKNKNFIPLTDDCHFKSIEKHVIEKPDRVCVTSYDTRGQDLLGEHKLGDLIVAKKLGEQIGVDKVYFNANNHHLHHAITAQHFSGFDECIIVVMDGGGSQLFPTYQEIESIYTYNKGDLKRVYLHATSDRFPYEGHVDKKFIFEGTDVYLSDKKSMGMLFEDMCLEYGMKNVGDAGKIMGLAAYEEKPMQLQEHSKNYTIELLKKAFTYSDSNNIVLSGGYALNCVNNYAYASKFHTKNFFIDPVAHDGGTSIGAALSVNNE